MWGPSRKYDLKDAKQNKPRRLTFNFVVEFSEVRPGFLADQLDNSANGELGVGPLMRDQMGHVNVQPLVKLNQIN